MRKRVALKVIHYTFAPKYRPRIDTWCKAAKIFSRLQKQGRLKPRRKPTEREERKWREAVEKAYERASGLATS